MQGVNINSLIDKNNFLIKGIPINKIIVGKINRLNINNIFNGIDLSNIECNEIDYYNQEGESIRSHILPNSLKELWCHNNQLTVLPNLPNSLKILNCYNNELTSLPNLPNSLTELYCSKNKLKLLPYLPNSLKGVYCYNNQLTSLPDHLPDSLKILDCSHNQLTSLPDFFHINHKIILGFYQDLPISYIPYNINIKLGNIYINKINIEDYPHNPITNQEELNKYMEFIKNYKMNKIKSARK